MVRTILRRCLKDRMSIKTCMRDCSLHAGIWTRVAYQIVRLEQLKVVFCDPLAIPLACDMSCEDQKMERPKVTPSPVSVRIIALMNTGASPNSISSQISDLIQKSFAIPFHS